MDAQTTDLVALKDENLIYCECSTAFARMIGQRAPEDVVGKSDFDLFSRSFAREQMSIDSRVFFTGKADVSAFDPAGCTDVECSERTRPNIMVRTPLLDEVYAVRGIDLKIYEEVSIGEYASDVNVKHLMLPDERSFQVNEDLLDKVTLKREPIVAPSVKQKDDWRRLRTSEQRFRDYVRAAADFFWEIDAAQVFRVVSDGFSEIIGIPRDHLLGRKLSHLLDLPGNVNDKGHWQEHLKRINHQLAFRDFEFRWSNGRVTRVIRYSGVPVFNQANEFDGYRGIGCDVTLSARQERSATYQANHDALTGIHNRRSFDRALKESLQAADHSRDTHVLCFMDLDSFKVVNDTCGHLAGDELLCQLTRLFESLVRKSDVLARLGGDEFGVLLYKCGCAEALKLANQIRQKVEQFQFAWEEKSFSVGVSIGLVIVDDRWESTEALLNAADSACYIAKHEGRNRVVVYREGKGNVSNRKDDTPWVQQIASALDAHRFRLAAQKILPLHEVPDGLRFEMLLRLEMSDGELVSPQAFLPDAERYGLSSALDERALLLCVDWLSNNPALQHVIRNVSINVSAGTCTEPDRSRRLAQLILERNIDPTKLCFEISETTAIANLSKVTDFVEEMSSIGCLFSIDNFGSGLSSFRFLRHLPIEFVKIDGLLVKDILNDQTHLTIVKAICEITKSMERSTIAGCIESSEHLDIVRNMGIDFGQGFHLGAPELVS